MRNRAQGVVGRIPDIDSIVGRDLDAQSLPDGELSPENADSVRNAPESGAAQRALTRRGQTLGHQRARRRPAAGSLGRHAASHRW